jgi:hypothetical protein
MAHTQATPQSTAPTERNWILATDQALRDDPHVRIYAALLVEALKNHIEDLGWELATLHDATDALTHDFFQDVLLWQLMEFLSDTTIDRQSTEFGPEYWLGCRHAHQLSDAHLVDYFDLERGLPSLKFWQVVEGNQILADARDFARQVRRRQQARDEQQEEIEQAAKIGDALGKGLKRQQEMQARIDELEARIAKVEKGETE